jgi:hypothetical protein
MLAVCRPTNVEDKRTYVKKEKSAILPSMLIHKMASGLPNPRKKNEIKYQRK